MSAIASAFTPWKNPTIPCRWNPFSIVGDATTRNTHAARPYTGDLSKNVGRT